jgi:hypothetical protein
VSDSATPAKGAGAAEAAATALGQGPVVVDAPRVRRASFTAAQAAGLPPLVAQLLLAHAEASAATRCYGAAAGHLMAYTELLSAAGLDATPEFAQARMQLGDLSRRLGQLPVEAQVQNQAAAAVLVKLHGPHHFRVGRALLAAARCSPELAAPVQAGQGAVDSGVSASGRGGGKRSLEEQLLECQRVHTQSQVGGVMVWGE